MRSVQDCIYIQQTMSIGTVHAHFKRAGVLTKRDMQNMQSGGTRGLELRTAALVAP